MTSTWKLFNTTIDTGVYEDKTVGKYVITPTHDRSRINIRSMATVGGTIDAIDSTSMDNLEKLIPGLTFDHGEVNSAFGLYHSKDEVIFPVGTNQIIGVIVRRKHTDCMGSTAWYTDYVCFIDARKGVRIKNTEEHHYGTFICDAYSDINIYVFSYINIENCLIENSVCKALDAYCACTPWTDAGCIDSKTKKYLRSCSPPGCLAEEDLRTDPICACTTQYTDYDLGCIRDGVRRYKRVWRSGYEYCAPPSGVEYYEKSEAGCVCGNQYTDTDMGCVRIGVRKYKRTWDAAYRHCSANGTGVDYYEISDPGCIMPVDVCSYAHPELCKTYADCTNAGLYWYNNMCNTSPQSVCSYNTPENCKTKTECEDVGRYWYNNKCNRVPEKEKPWYDWFTQETLMPGVQNWILVTLGVAVPVTIGGIAYWALRKK